MSDKTDTSRSRSRLSGAKRALLEKRLSGGPIHGSKPHLISRYLRQDKVPLSFAQERFWFLDQWEPGNPAHNRPAFIHLRGPLNLKALEQSINEILRRHEVLRARFPTVAGGPTQVITQKLTLCLPVVDLSDQTETDCKDEVQRLATEEAHCSFDLAEGPLLRVTLLRVGKKDHVLLLTVHHIVFDGWSMGILIHQLSTHYEAFCNDKPSTLPELRIQYADFAQWQRDWLQGEVFEKQLSYWKKRLGGEVPVLNLPTDRPRPPVQTYRGARQSLLLAKHLSESLKDLSRQEGVTLFMTLLAAFQTLLHRYTAQDDIIVGSPISGRNRIETEELIGVLINTLVLRTDLSGNPTFRELLIRVREMALGAFAHQDLPFEKLIEALRPGRDMSNSPLFQVSVMKYEGQL